jgi:hypothetical protein
MPTASEAAAQRAHPCDDRGTAINADGSGILDASSADI